MRIDRGLTQAFVLATLIGATAGVAEAQYPPPMPPPTYVATVDPVYYNGQATYWYQDHWYWRDARGAWNYYRDEPPTLRDRRMHAPPARHIEERHDDHHDAHGRR